MQSVGLRVPNVVDEVETTGKNTKDCEGHHCLFERPNVKQLATEDDPREQQSVLDPLSRPHRHDCRSQQIASAPIGRVNRGSGGGWHSCHPGFSAATSNSPAAFQSIQPLTPIASAASICALTSSGP